MPTPSSHFPLIACFSLVCAAALQAESAPSIYAKAYDRDYYDQGYFVDTDRDIAANGQVTGTGPVDEALICHLKTNPAHGMALVSPNGAFTYQPAQGFVGLDAFWVTVTAQSVESAAATVRVSVGYTKNDYMAALERRFPAPKSRHPRLVYTDADLRKLIDESRTNAYLSRTIRNIINEADHELSTQPEKTFSAGSYRGLIEKRYLNLALAYKFTNDVRYLERFVREARVSCDPKIFSDWGQAGKGGEITFGQIVGALSLAYDLLYNALDPDTRTTIEKAVIRNAYAPAYEQLMASGGIYGAFNNFNGIGSAGLALSAMAMCDSSFGGDSSQQAMTQDVLAKAVRCLQRALTSFRPDGAYYEGLGYGMWMTRQLAMPCLAVERTFGLPLPEEATKAFYRSPEWFNGVQAGASAFGNGEDKTTPGMETYPVSVFFAAKADRPDYAWLHHEKIVETGGQWADFLFYDASAWSRASDTKPLTRDVCFHGYELAVLHSDYANPDENSVSLYAGTNIEWHMALELGTVQLNALGTSWFISLGRDDYGIPGYGLKSNVYRKRAEGRNTLVINPSDGPDQSWARGRLSAFASSQNESSAIADISGAYAGSAESVRRGVRLFNRKTEFLIQDEIRAKTPAEVYSFYHTAQSVALADGGRVAELTDARGNRLRAQILAPSDAVFTVMAARLLPTSPHVGRQAPNDGVQKLAVHLLDVTNATLALWIVPLAPSQPAPAKPPEIRPLDAWDATR